MSAFSSMSCTVASYVSPLCSCTFTCWWLDLLTTCALVTMSPLSDTRKPEPLVMGTLRPYSGCLGVQRVFRAAGRGSLPSRGLRDGGHLGPDMRMDISTLWPPGLGGHTVSPPSLTMYSQVG